MSKKMCLTAAVAFGIWNIFYIFVLCNSVVVEYFENNRLLTKNSPKFMPQGYNGRQQEKLRRAVYGQIRVDRGGRSEYC